MIRKKLNNITLAVFAVASLLLGCNNAPEVQISSDKSLANVSLKVWGNCEMCQETIEESLKTKGVSAASWNSETKILDVKFDSTLISIDQIHKRVASSGYDTERYKADEESYKNLHECCQYERRP